MVDLPEPIARVLREVVAPLVEADGGVVYWVPRVPPGVAVRLHLAGTCAGCPGTRTTTREVIEPALRAAGARGEIEVTAGWIVPDGAQRVAAEPLPSIADSSR